MYNEGRIANALEQILAQLQQLVSIEGERRDIENQILDLLRQESTVPVGFRVTTTPILGDKVMTPAVKATVDLQILDDGKGVLFTLTPVNQAGNPVPLPTGDTVTATSSVPGSLAVASNPGDTTGLVFLGTVPQPPVDATGIVVTFSAAFGSTAANPIDVVSDSSPVGFTITEAAE